MTKRPLASSGKSVKPKGSRLAERGPATIEPVAAPSRIDRLVALADHCAAAQALAEGMNETFLVHMLAMVILEANLTMRHTAPDPL